MSTRRNSEGITVAAARAVATTSPRFGQWGIEKRLRDQLVANELAVVEQHGRETRTRLTDYGKQCRKGYRHAGLHKLPRKPEEKMTPEQRQEWIVACGEIASAAAAVMTFI